MIEELGAQAALALAAAATLRADVRAGAARWSPDSYDYAIRMLQRCGVPKAEAAERARAFFADAGDRAAATIFAGAYEGEPIWWTLFAPRVVYPALAALLYPRRGFAALTDVAAASYVASAVALYRLLRRFADRSTAAALTLWYVRDRAVRDAAVHGMSDSTAMLLWIAVLDAAAEIADGRPRWLRLTALAAALSFTRPLPYLPFAGGVALALRGVVRRDGARVRAGAGIAAVALACAAAVSVVLKRAGVPPPREHLERVRAAQRWVPLPGRLEHFTAAVGLEDRPEHSLARWYAGAVTVTLAASLKHAAFAVVPVLAVPGLLRAKHGAVPLLAGALAGGLIGCVADPDARASRRTIVLPLYPVFAAGCALAIMLLKRRAPRER